MKISIITSVKNGEPFIREAVASVKAQSHANWEYLIIDAGSDDGGWAYVEEEAAGDERIRCIRRDGEPLYQSLAWGLDQCSGDYLAWLNADDLYPRWSFQSLCTFVEKTRAEWVTGLPACWDEAGALRFVRPRAWHPRRFIRAGMFNLQALGFLQQESMFFSRELFARLTVSERATFAAQKFAGDFFLWKTLAEHAPLATAPAVLGGFRAHGANMSAANMDAYMDEVRVLGGWVPNPRVGAWARRAFEAASAVTALGAVRRAEEALANGGEASCAP